MSHVKYLFYFIFLHLIIATPQINLYYTDRINESDNGLQHDCLRIAARIEQVNVNRQIMSYCMSQSPSEFNVKNDDFFPNFTFAKLSKQNITSQQLYLWSAPIDIIEHYQFYLNQLSTSNDSFLATKVFYNCTMPRFGPVCEYEFVYHHSNHLSLYEIIHDFYHTYKYDPTNFTCYTHLQCNRGPHPSCLDWSEICNENIDCLDGEFDEEHCWELDMNQCKDNEYQCTNGQCIPQSFFQDDPNVPDCLDGSDEFRPRVFVFTMCTIGEPSFGCEDSTCQGTPLTSSCVENRRQLLSDAMFSIKDSSISDACWIAFKCMMDIRNPNYSTCEELCKDNVCIRMVYRECPDMLYIPTVPVLFGDIYFAYQKRDSRFLLHNSRCPYVCYNNSRYDDYFINAEKVLFNNATCYYRDDMLDPLIGLTTWDVKYLTPFNRALWDYYQISKYNQTGNQIYVKCNRSNIYHCHNSYRCISINNFMDGTLNCPHGDDENITKSNNRIAAEQLIGIYGWYDEEVKVKLRVIRKNILFQIICDGFTELSPQIIDGQNETDETECEQWQCNNIYTRCDDIWNCLDGADELGCNVSLPLNCSSDHHMCVSPHTNKFMCLSIKNANDGNVDCLGATDEPMLCRPTYKFYPVDSLFYCMNATIHLCISFGGLCNGNRECSAGGDDEQFCENQTLSSIISICHPDNLPFASDVEKFLCNYTMFKSKQQIKYFTLDEMMKSGEDPLNDMNYIPPLNISTIEMSDQHQPRCHRGLDLRVWLNNKNNSTNPATCLCPPSFYGDQCQYQNQRISLVIRFRALSDSWQIPFAIVILLIDDNDQRIIHSYEQFTYLSMRDCKIKFNIYLLYSTRPKDSTRNYSIHIDIYEKVSLDYRGSLLFPITFSFLPVHRLAFIIDIPSNDDKTESCSHNQCIYGKCIRYLNNPENNTFCQCDEGWSGQYCNIQHICMCSSDSLCLGVSANNRSICICPINKFGPRCLLIDAACQTNTNATCQNDGQCIPNDDYMISDQKFVCICPKGFSGHRCEVTNNKLIISFEKSIVISQSIRIHFIQVINNSAPVTVTTFKTIPVKQNSVTIYWSRPFHLVFIELFIQNYYLTVVQKSYSQSITIIKMINPSDRCQNISKLFNETFVQLDLLRRIKYYHLLCQRYSPDLLCFYDEVHFCLCYDYNGKRLANCLEFKHNMTFDCSSQSLCKNGVQCFQDDPDCPKRSMCICRPCFYGIRCQFSTNGFGLSLDAILGYHILPHLSLTQQPSIVQFSLTLTIIFIIAGLINGIFSLITFKNKIVREVGCGLYLLGSSITTLLTTIMFGLKFLILVLAQMTLISNRSFLRIQCISLDFILRVCLCTDQWLNACVAFERAITAIKGTSFVKKKSKQTAKFVIVILLIVIISTCVHDPINRRLIDEENDDDDDQKRIWCIVHYSSNWEVYNYIIHIFHFFGPFLINLISAVILITKKSRQQSNFHKQQSYKEHLTEQCRQHKHLFTAPVILVTLAVPRLIITFVSKCMKSANDVWLFLIGYFISFIPPMLTFIIFIVPSKFYRKEFCKSLAYYQTYIQRRLHLIP